LLEDRLEQAERREHVLVRQRTGPFLASGRECRLDCTVLAFVLGIELVDRRVPRCPDRGSRERAPRALRYLLDERRSGDAVDHVVETMIRPHPLGGQRTAVASRVASAQRARETREPLLGPL